MPPSVYTPVRSNLFNFFAVGKENVCVILTWEKAYGKSRRETLTTGGDDDDPDKELRSLFPLTDEPKVSISSSLSPTVN